MQLRLNFSDSEIEVCGDGTALAGQDCRMMYPWVLRLVSTELAMYYELRPGQIY